MARGSQNMTTFKAKGLTSIANTVDTSNFIFLKTTALTADQLGNTISLSLNAASVTGAANTNHSIFLNVGVGSGLGTPFQLQIPDSSHLYIYKRWYSSSAWSGWSKISAGHADDAAKWTTARTITLTGSVTGSVSIDGSGNVSLATTTNHNHDWRYPQNHITSFAFTGNNRPLSRYVTFDVSAPAGGPGGWINGFMSVHNDYLASYIVQVHRSDDWYLGWNQYSTTDSTVSTAPVWRKIIHSGNIGSQSVNYSTSAGNADTVDNLHASDFVRAYGTTNDNINSDWGQSFKTFDPIPSGTPPAKNPNISTINIGDNFNRRKQLAFVYSANEMYLRRRVDGTWSGWSRFLHNGNYTEYTVTKTGGGASGKWSINITGHADSDLALTGGTVTGNISMQDNGVNAKQANNGVSSTRYPTTFNILDKNGYILTRQEAVVLSSGEIRSYWYVRNYNTSGGLVAQKGITLIMNKAGTMTYSVDDAANFRSAIGVGASGTHADSYFALSGHTHNWLELAPGNKAASTGAEQSNDTGPFTVRWYSQTGKIAQQPTQYGFLITCAAGKGSSEQHALWLEQCDGHIYHRGTNGGNNTSPPAFKMLWQRGDAVTSAVWNDYAEARESLCTEPGRAVQETGFDTLALIIERLAPCAGIVSDTWGFSQGETDNAKTHIAVAGRVLAYPYRNRSEYKPGDVLCAAPNGTVDIMTREEVIQYPDRIVGIVSCVPNYEEWGGGKGADRPPVKVNGRIWVKVR